MARAKEKTRIYTGTDAEMIEASRVMHGLFKEDTAAFGNFDSSFDAQFETSWLQKIEEADSMERDTQSLGELTSLTGIVEDKLEECRQHIQYLKYFIEKAFPGKPGIFTQFGLDDYNEARKSETKMIQLLGILHKSLVKYQAEIAAAGVSVEKIELTEALQTQLTDANYNQEIAKKKRPAVTQERITAFNECYEFMQKVSRAGKIIFANDYSKYNQYLLPNERGSKTNIETPQEEEPVK